MNIITLFLVLLWVVQANDEVTVPAQQTRRDLIGMSVADMERLCRHIDRGYGYYDLDVERYCRRYCKDHEVVSNMVSFSTPISPKSHHLCLSLKTMTSAIAAMIPHEGHIPPALWEGGTATS